VPGSVCFVAFSFPPDYRTGLIWGHATTGPRDRGARTDPVPCGRSFAARELPQAGCALKGTGVCVETHDDGVSGRDYQEPVTHRYELSALLFPS
jgi:hypothetical protein